MAVGILGTPATGQLPGTDSYTPETGDSSRLLLIYIAAEDFFDVSLSAVTIGGVGATLGNRHSIRDAAANRYCIGEWWYIKEASIPVGSSAIATTWSGAPDHEYAVLYTLSGVNQTTPVDTTSDDGTTAATDTDVSGSMTVASNGASFTGLSSDAANTSGCTITAGWTERYDADVGSGHMYVADKVGASGTENYTVTFGGQQREGSLTSISIAVDGAGIVASPATMVDGTTGYTLTTSGFGSNISSVSMRSKQDNTHSVSLSFSGSGDDYTIDSPDFKSNTNTSGIAGCPFTSAYDTLELVVTDGTDTVLADVTFNPATGWDEVKTSSTPSIAQGSIYENFDGFYETISAVSVANPTTMTITGHGFTNGQDLTNAGTNTTATTVGEFVWTETDANSGTIPVNVSSVTDGTGTALTGVANEHGQVLFPTTDSTSVATDGTLETSKTSSFYCQYFDYVDSKMKAVLVTVTSGAGSTGLSIGIGLHI